MKTRFFPLVVVFLSALFPQRTPAQSSINWEPNTAPPYWVENFTHDDQSTSRVLVFQSTPGVSYTVETSHDLSQWTKGQTFYGLGQEISIPMLQTAAPPANAPTTPSGNPSSPAVSKIVSLMLRPTANNGVVINWHSLDNKSPVEHHFGTLTMDEAWESNLYYMKQYGGHYFCISHPLATAVPKINSTLGPLDAAMVASFEANFATMNAEVADAVDRARLNPITPAPFDPNSRKFFRIVADWGLDSDFDLSPDWVEFMGMMGVNGMEGTTTGTDANGNPFEVVSNPFGDNMTPEGLPAGKVADHDNDGVADVEDVDPANSLLNWHRQAIRYALFNVTVPTAVLAHDTRALQTNNKGQVLFRKSVWREGSHTTLSVGSGNWSQALAMNDLGAIFGQSDLPGLPFAPLCVWGAADSGLQIITSQSEDGNTVYAQMTENHFFGGFVGQDIFTESRRFFAPGLEVIDGVGEGAPKTIVGINNSAWEADASGQYTYQLADAEEYYAKDPGYRWGYPDTNGDTFLDGQTLKASISKLVVMPFGSRIACGSYGATNKSHIKYLPSSWQVVTQMVSVKDFSHIGVGITQDHKIWLNNSLLVPSKVIPDVETAPWNSGNFSLQDLSDKGHLLVVKEDTLSPQGIALGHSHAALAYPFTLEDNSPATGVDVMSQTANPSDDPLNGFQEKLWVMAPQGTWVNSNGVTEPNRNDFYIKVPLDDLSATIAPENATSTRYDLVGDSTNVGLSGAGSETNEGNLEISIGDAQSISYPIGIKSMKRRTVNVHIYRCHQTPQLTPGQNDPYPYTTATVTEYLNDVYGSQINVYFQVTESTVIAGQNGMPSPLYPTVLHNEVSYMPTSFLTEFMNSIPRNSNADIHVILTGHSLITGSGAVAGGIAPQNTNTVVMSATRHFENMPIVREEVAQRVLAHEIGHVFCGAGHPDEGGGVAKLPGTDHQKRLMCSGGMNSLGSRLLVKAEWDAAEEWLENFPDKRMLDTNGSIPGSY